MYSYPTYSTHDLNLASVLNYYEIPFDGAEKTSETQVKFYFKRTPEIDNFIEQYHKKSLKVEPNDFYYSQRFLKGIIASKSINY